MQINGVDFFPCLLRLFIFIHEFKKLAYRKIKVTLLYIKTNDNI
jgi:hypothetical protein